MPDWSARRSPSLNRLQDWSAALMATRSKILPLIVYDYEHRREEFFREALAWHGEGRLAWKEDVAEGLEAAPEAFCRLMRGGNFGKSLVRVS